MIAELRALEVIAPRHGSTTQWVPFVQVDEATWQRVLAVCEAAQRASDEYGCAATFGRAMDELYDAVAALSEAK